MTQGGGRIGEIEVLAHPWGKSERIVTPYVFPVINVIGGPPGPDRNGGLWRPVKWWMFLQERMPAYLCQVLHALDFNIKRDGWNDWKQSPFGKRLTEWQQKTEYPSTLERYDFGYPFREWMTNWEFFRQPAGSQLPTPPVTFLDSGGFTLMKRDAFQKAQEWYDIETTPEAILDVQMALGGDLIASLDYPLPPGLKPEEIRERQRLSIDNAIEMLIQLEQRRRSEHINFPALPYVAVHGTTGNEVEQYILQFGEKWRGLAPQVQAQPFGFAIGSMVPRADNPLTVIDVAMGVRRAIEQLWTDSAFNTDKEGNPRSEPPVHMFGITSHLMWFLVYLGIDSFDSSTFADVAKRAGYLDEDLRSRRITEVTEQMVKDCHCPYCTKIAEMGVLGRMQELLDPEHKRPKGRDRYYPEFWNGLRATNSDMYGLLAMHNWHRIARIQQKIFSSVDKDRLAEDLVAMVKEHNGNRGDRLLDALSWLAHNRPDDKRLHAAIQTEYHKELDLPARIEKPLHLRTHRRPSEFQLPSDYRPKPNKKFLLLMACSKGKPYRESTHQRQVLDALRETYPETTFQDHLHKVTLSGLYGPVPEESEDLPQVKDYDFMLEVGDKSQAQEVEQRLEAFLTSNQDSYEKIYAYFYFPAYRAVVEKVLHKLGLEGRLFPADVGRGESTIDYRDELITAIGQELGLQRATANAADFQFDTATYTPPDDKDILLLIPSAGHAPYVDYGDQKNAMHLIHKAFPEEAHRIHRVTLSALYGPVPEELERLAPAEYAKPEEVGRRQLALAQARLTEFLTCVGPKYPGGVILYCRTAGYRSLVHRVLHETHMGILVPAHTGPEVTQTRCQEELLRLLVLKLDKQPAGQLKFTF